MLNFLRRCVTTLVGKDDRDIRVQQVSSNGSASEEEIYAPYGMSYNLPPDCLCLHLQVGGDTGNIVVLPDRSQDRVKNLKEGEVAFFNPLTKTRTIYRENGDMEIVTEGDLTATVAGDTTITSTGDVTITAPLIKLVGDTKITGTLDVTGTTTAPTVAATTSLTVQGKEMDEHRHGGSSTAPDGPVSNTGIPV